MRQWEENVYQRGRAIRFYLTDYLSAHKVINNYEFWYLNKLTANHDSGDSEGVIGPRYQPTYLPTNILFLNTRDDIYRCQRKIYNAIYCYIL